MCPARPVAKTPGRETPGRVDQTEFKFKLDSNSNWIQIQTGFKFKSVDKDRIGIRFDPLIH
jgi:hypothetical protein